jgi:hypothetical protein
MDIRTIFFLQVSPGFFSWVHKRAYRYYGCDPLQVQYQAKILTRVQQRLLEFELAYDQSYNDNIDNVDTATMNTTFPTFDDLVHDIAGYPLIYGICLQRQYLDPNHYPQRHRVRTGHANYLYSLIGSWGPLFFPYLWSAFKLWWQSYIRYHITNQQHRYPPPPPSTSTLITNTFAVHNPLIWTPYIIHFHYLIGGKCLYGNFPLNFSLIVNHREKGENYQQQVGPDARLLSQQTINRLKDPQNIQIHSEWIALRQAYYHVDPIWSLAYWQWDYNQRLLSPLGHHLSSLIISPKYSNNQYHRDLSIVEYTAVERTYLILQDMQDYCFHQLLSSYYYYSDEDNQRQNHDYSKFPIYPIMIYIELLGSLDALLHSSHQYRLISLEVNPILLLFHSIQQLQSKVKSLSRTETHGSKRASHSISVSLEQRLLVLQALFHSHRLFSEILLVTTQETICETWNTPSSQHSYTSSHINTVKQNLNDDLLHIIISQSYYDYTHFDFLNENNQSRYSHYHDRNSNCITLSKYEDHYTENDENKHFPSVLIVSVSWLYPSQHISLRLATAEIEYVIVIDQHCVSAPSLLYLLSLQESETAYQMIEDVCDASRGSDRGFVIYQRQTSLRYLHSIEEEVKKNISKSEELDWVLMSRRLSASMTRRELVHVRSNLFG